MRGGTKVVFSELGEFEFTSELFDVVVRAPEEEDRLEVREALLGELSNQLDEVHLALQDDRAGVDDGEKTCTQMSPPGYRGFLRRG